MHKLLGKQLELIGATDKVLDQEQKEQLFSLVSQAYDKADGRILQLLSESQLTLEKSEEKYSRLIQNLKDHYFFYTHDDNGVFTYISDSITDILGYSVEEFLTHFEEYLTDDPMNEKVVECTNRSLQGIQQEPYEVSIYHKNGDIVYLEVTEIPIFDEDGKVIFIDGIARDITLQYKTKQEVSHLAKHDTLTGLSNRLYLEEQLESIIASTDRAHSSFALLFLDLDHFKGINDTLGHDIGDKLLQEVTNRIKPSIRKGDVFARIGGDEFIIVLTNLEYIDLPASIGKIIKLMRDIWKIDNYELKVSTSIGIALYPKDGTSLVELMKNADIAMYKAKELGRDNFSFFTEELNEKVHKDMRLEQDMAKALENNEFELYYQSQQGTQHNNLIGAEALVRWNHPEFGLISPDQFIELAESTGFIVKLGRWVIEEGCRAISRFNAKDKKHELRLSVNVSTRQLQLDDIYLVVEKALKDANISASQFSIEITESVMVDNNEKIIEQLSRLNKLGVTIYLDDFGTGYSSLSYLNRLPISAFKIDKVFVDEISKDKSKGILLDSMIAMGKALNIGVIAEGVEEEYQREYLLEQKCSCYQGYLVSKPVPEEQFFSKLITQ